MHLFPLCGQPLPKGLEESPASSGPLLDRFDIHVEVPRVDYDKLTDERLGEVSAAVRERVEAAREWQRQRFAGANLTCNADMGPAQVRQFCAVDQAGKSLLRAAVQQLHMSARAYHRILKVSRTIADLAGSEDIETPRRLDGRIAVADARELDQPQLRREVKQARWRYGSEGEFDIFKRLGEGR